MSQTQSNAMSQKWQQVLSELVVKAEELAQSSQRKGKMSVEQFVQTLVLGCLEQEKVSLRLWSAVASDLGCEVTGSSIDERLNKRAVFLLYQVLQLLCLQQQVDVSKLPVADLHQFSRLVRYDSTALSLPPILKHTFRASTDSGLGHMKLQVGYDYLNAQLCSLSVHEGIDPDQKDVGLLEQAVQDALLIFDLGYFDQQVLAKIEAQGAYFVTHYQSQTGLYDPQTEEMVDLLDHLKQRQGDWFEATYKLGRNAKVKVRLIARRVSQQEVEKRRRQVKKHAEDGGIQRHNAV